MNSTILLFCRLITRLAEHAKCLVSQLLHIKQAKTLFEKVSPIVQKLSSRAGTSSNMIFIDTAVIHCEDEQQHNVLRGSLEL